MSEATEQAALVQWAQLNEQQYPELRYLFHIPNGGWRHYQTAVRLKGQGVKRGVPDLFLPFPLPGLWIEMKFGKNKLTPNQSRWCRELSRAGYHVAVCWSFEEARDVLIDYLERKSNTEVK
jgi:hypothetical protein